MIGGIKISKKVVKKNKILAISFDGVEIVSMETLKWISAIFCHRKAKYFDADLKKFDSEINKSKNRVHVDITATPQVVSGISSMAR